MTEIPLPAQRVNEGSIGMGQATEKLKDIESQTATTIENETKNLVRYGIQIAMLNSLLSHGLITEKECHKISEQLRGDYGIASAA